MVRIGTAIFGARTRHENSSIPESTGYTKPV
jgi:hypothetical protein